MNRSRLVTLFSALLLVSAIACGGGGGSSTDAGTDTVVTTDNGSPDTAGVDTPIPDTTGTDTTPIDPGKDTTVPPDVPVDVQHPDVCTNACDAAGVRECIVDAPGNYRVCEAGRDGCLAWSAPMVCGQGTACVDGECTASCTSDPGCEAAGDKRCSGANTWQECYEAAAGCFKYGAAQTCPASMACGATAECECLSDCGTEGLRRCFAAGTGKEFQVCATNANGCLLWSSPEVCADGGACEGDGQCKAVCESDVDCTAAGDVRCASASAVQVCAEVETGCLKWGEKQACPGLLTCTDGKCQVKCSSDNGCTAVGVLSCLDEGHERACVEVEPGCLKWDDPVACPHYQFCGAGEGCACEDPCEAGESKCASSDARYRMFCNVDAAGCTYWAWDDCGVGAECEDGECKALCQSDPACTAVGVKVCETLGSFAECAEVESGCIRKGAPQACPAHQSCTAATGTCACAVQAGCTVEGTKECVDGSHFRACTKDAAGCLYWSDGQECTGATTCTAGECTSTCTSDTGCAKAGDVRCATTSTFQACAEIEAGCLKWGVAATCPDRQACVGDAGCACTNPCAEGQTRCLDATYLNTCDAADAAGCRAWKEAEACEAGLSCVAGACASVLSPETGCGQVTVRLVDLGYEWVKVSGTFGEDPYVWVDREMALVDGVWSVTIDGLDGRLYEYKFIADGNWLRDPLNPYWIGYPPFDNSVVDVPQTSGCTAGQFVCMPFLGLGGSSIRMECVADAYGCTSLVTADDACVGPEGICQDAQCVPVVSPVVVGTTVTFALRTYGGEYSVAGDFTDPAWGVRIPLVADGDVARATVTKAEYPGLTVGEHQYKFVRLDDVWFYDPVNPLKVDDGMTGYNSVFTLTLDCPDACTPGTECVDDANERTCAAAEGECPAWGAPVACGDGSHCVRGECETFPVIDPAQKTVTFVVRDAAGIGGIKAAGTFTTPAWDLDQAPSLTLSGGLWTGTIGVAPGTHQYKFYVTMTAGGEDWQTDALNPVTVDDGNGHTNSQFVMP